MSHLFSGRDFLTRSSSLSHCINNQNNLQPKPWPRQCPRARLLYVPILCVAMIMSSCALGYREWFPANNIHVIHSELHCRDADQPVTTQFPNSDLVYTENWGIGLFVASRKNWEIIGRQLAAEMDGDISLIRPCDGQGSSFEFKQLEVWRTRGFKPQVEEYRRDAGVLMAPVQSTYGTRLKDIFECFEQARMTDEPISSDNKKRLGQVNATEFFNPDPYFSGYPRVDQHFRPARTGDLSLSMIYSDRARAAWAAGIYKELPYEEKPRFADRYLACLLNRGYRL